MKTVIIIFLSVLAINKSTAQKSEVLDTIYANDQMNVALFFPDPIRQGITGADNFVFTYNREKQQYFGLLQAKPGKESNLLVINQNGSIFSYIVRYRKHLSKLNYIIPQDSRIGNEKPLVADTLKTNDPKLISENKNDHYRRFCSYLLDRKQQIGLIKKRNNGMVLSVLNIVYDKEELYFVIQIENKSSLAYDLNFLNLSIKTLQKGKRKSLQTLVQNPLFKYNVPSRIRENETVKFVYILPKFSLSNDRRAMVELNEANGERNLKLNISHKFINNPN